MITYTTAILRFDNNGDKTGWTYIEIPEDVAQQLKPGNKKSFRVKGKLDDHVIKMVSLLPMGNGSFILPINGAMRKATHKSKGAMIKVQLAEDKAEYKLNAEFLECLADEPKAKEYFDSLTNSFKSYYSKWIDSAKTEATKTKRIALAVSSLAVKIDFGEMLRSQKKLSDNL